LLLARGGDAFALARGAAAFAFVPAAGFVFARGAAGARFGFGGCAAEAGVDVVAEASPPAGFAARFSLRRCGRVRGSEPRTSDRRFSLML
jgi:hypothetical protein